MESNYLNHKIVPTLLIRDTPYMEVLAQGFFFLIWVYVSSESTNKWLNISKWVIYFISTQKFKFIFHIFGEEEQPK